MSDYRSFPRPLWSSVLLTLLALITVYVVGTTFFNVEIERPVERTITPRILASRGVEVMNQEMTSDLEGFMASKHIRLIGYACLIIIVLLTLLGLITDKTGWAFLGSLSFILPIYAYLDVDHRLCGLIRRDSHDATAWRRI